MDDSGAGLGRRTSFCEGGNPTLVPGKQEFLDQMCEYQLQVSILSREGWGGGWG